MPLTAGRTRLSGHRGTTSRDSPENAVRIVPHIGSHHHNTTTKKAMVMTVELAHPEVWMTEGLCTQTDPEVFYPRPGEARAVQTAKRICYDCPIQMRCLTFALDQRERHGIWGGLTPAERSRLADSLEEIRRGDAA